MQNQEALQLATQAPKSFAPSPHVLDAHLTWPGGSVWCLDQQEGFRSFTTCISFVLPHGGMAAGIAFVIQDQVRGDRFHAATAVSIHTWFRESMRLGLAGAV